MKNNSQNTVNSWSKHEQYHYHICLESCLYHLRKMSSLITYDFFNFCKLPLNFGWIFVQLVINIFGFSVGEGQILCLKSEKSGRPDIRLTGSYILHLFMEFKSGQLLDFSKTFFSFASCWDANNHVDWIDHMAVRMIPWLLLWIMTMII